MEPQMEIWLSDIITDIPEEGIDERITITTKDLVD